jgi:hypothetical protein
LLIHTHTRAQLVLFLVNNVVISMEDDRTEATDQLLGGCLS